MKTTNPSVDEQILGAIGAAWDYIAADSLALGPLSQKSRIAEAWDRVEFFGYDDRFTKEARAAFKKITMEELVAMAKRNKYRL